MYGVLRVLDGWIRVWWRAGALGNVVELRVAGSRTGRLRRVLLTLLRDGDRWFLGHPNGDVAWTLNLEAAGTADVILRGGPALTISARRLEPGELRDRAILATREQPFPANIVYRLARAHIRAVGVFFVIEPASVA
jgi:hypothetical protein